MIVAAAEFAQVQRCNFGPSAASPFWTGLDFWAADASAKRLEAARKPN